MMFSKQRWFCNACGKEQNSVISANRWLGAMLCGTECIEEFKWRQTISIMGKEYYPRLTPSVGVVKSGNEHPDLTSPNEFRSHWSSEEHSS